ncbi:hypothetical protein V6E43_13370, partial [Enterobacter hormaechei]
DAIGRHDNDLLNHSTPELERYFSRPISEMQRKNDYQVAILLPLLLVIFAFNLLPFLQTISSMSPTLHTLSFFVPSLAILIFLMLASAFLARGYTSGLSGFLALFIILLTLTVLQWLHYLTISDGSSWQLIIATIALVISRMVLNSRGFVLFTLYCRSKRLATLARIMRLKSGKDNVRNT